MFAFIFILKTMISNPWPAGPGSSFFLLHFELRKQQIGAAGWPEPAKAIFYYVFNLENHHFKLLAGRTLIHTFSIINLIKKPIDWGPWPAGAGPNHFLLILK